MIDLISRHKISGSNDANTFSILIPTWNNLAYLQLCINSILQNSKYSHQIIIIVNEGIDGTLAWVESQKFDYVYAKKNVGICLALNACRSLITTNYMAYANDDMYFLPNWDEALLTEINNIGHNKFMLSSTMIEPSGNNPCVVVQDFGDSIETFREVDLLNNYSKLARNDWNGSTWPPNVMHIDCWDLVGGMSIEFSPGMYSDPDLSRKLWEIGVRTFIGKGNSLVYHFGCKSTKRIIKNRGHKTFIMKWGITPKHFMNSFLLRGESAVNILPEKTKTKGEMIIQLFKQLKSCF